MFPGADSMGFVWGGVGQALMQVYAVVSRFCYVSSVGDLGDLVLPTLRNASGDVVTVYAYYGTKGRFLQSLGYSRAGQSLCRRHKMTVSTNVGLHE